MSAKQSRTRTPKPRYRIGQIVRDRDGTRAVVMGVPRKRPGYERLYVIAHENGQGGGMARESHLSQE